jgi:hypothetical protein
MIIGEKAWCDSRPNFGILASRPAQNPSVFLPNRLSLVLAVMGHTRRGAGPEGGENHANRRCDSEMDWEGLGLRECRAARARIHGEARDQRGSRNRLQKIRE